MKVINDENVVCWDCDDTLVMWDKDHETPSQGKSRIPITNPYSGRTVYLKPHQVHIRIMQEYKGRGFTNVVWSAGGVKWAEAVVQALGIQDQVDLVMTKPNRHFDDKEDKESVIGVRLYFEDKK